MYVDLLSSHSSLSKLVQISYYLSSIVYLVRDCHCYAPVLSSSYELTSLISLQTLVIKCTSLYASLLSQLELNWYLGAKILWLLSLCV